MELLHSDEFKKLETEYPFLRRAREQVFGLKALSYVVVDIETTGLEPGDSEITEIAAFRIEKGEITDVYSSLIKVDKPLPEMIIKLTGITDEILAEEGKEKANVLRAFYDFVKETPLIAHNSDFDIPFINHHLKKTWKIELKNPLICTLKLSRKLLSGLPSHKLGNVAAHFKIPTPLTHRAPGDVEITYQLWLKLIEILEKKGVTTLETLLKFI
ncbi:MAG: exonuclease domain-containing protein [bacterium]